MGTDRAEAITAEQVVSVEDRLVWPPYSGVSPAEHVPGSDPFRELRWLAWPSSWRDSGLKILDVGCGTGHISVGAAKHNARADVMGIDARATAVRAARDRAEKLGVGNVRFTACDPLDVERLNETFDLIYCTDVLMYVPDVREVLGHLRNVLLPEGVIFASFLGTHGRFGVTMIRDILRILGRGHISPFQARLARKLMDATNERHPFRKQEFAADLKSDDATFSHTFLHPEERTHTVAQVFELAEGTGLSVLRFVPGSFYKPEGYLTDPDALRSFGDLAPERRMGAAELLHSRIRMHNVLLALPDFDMQIPSLEEDDWLGAVPVRSRMWQWQPVSGGNGQVDGLSAGQSFWSIEHKGQFGGWQAQVVALCEGDRTLGDVWERVSSHPGLWSVDEDRRIEAFRAFIDKCVSRSILHLTR